MAGRTWIVIVNYRTADLAVDCLHSVARQISELQPLPTVVVDNASDHGSAKKLMEVIDRERWNGWASVLPLDRNGGFAFGNNAGIREALQSACHVDYVMLLNPDTILHRGAIRALVDFMDSHQRVGIAGGRLENADGATECSAHNAPSPLGELESGACLSILSPALYRNAEIGRVDELVRRLEAETRELPWADLILNREGAYDEKIGPQLVAARVKHFFHD